MTDQQIVRALETLGRELGVRIVYGRPRIGGGACTWRERDFVVLHRDSELPQRAALLADCLADRDLEDRELPEPVRALIDSARAAQSAAPEGARTSGP